jgi:hypothetical protein
LFGPLINAKTLSRASRDDEEQLLPLPADQVRRLSLKHHLAFAALCGGCGDVESIAALSNMLHLRAGCNAELYRCADSALAQCVARVECGGEWALTDAERAAFEPLRHGHDEQLTAVPVHRFLEALEQGQHAGLRPADRVGLVPKRCLPAMANAPSAWYARMNLQAGAATRGACVDAEFDSFYVETLGSGLEVGSCVVKAHHCALRRTG